MDNFKASQPQTPLVHYITRWSGERADETPLCGAGSYERATAGLTHDSAGERMNICAACAKLHAERMPTGHLLAGAAKQADADRALNAEMLAALRDVLSDLEAGCSHCWGDEHPASKDDCSFCVQYSRIEQLIAKAEVQS